MAQELLKPSIIAKEALMQLDNNLGMGKLVHRAYKDEYVKVGDTVTIRKPVRFRAISGAQASVQDVEEYSTSITVNKRYHVAWKFSSQELTLNIEKYSERYIKPAMIQLANQIDQDLLGLAIDIPWAVGTAGTTPATFAVIGDAAQKMDEMAVPASPRYLAINPAANYKLADALKGLYASQKRVEDIIAKGYLGSICNFDIYSFQNVGKFTQGTADMDGDIEDASIAEKDTTLGIHGLGTGTVAKGTVLTIAGVYALNPVSKVVYPWLQQFVVTADATITSNAATVSVYPPFQSAVADPYRNINALPVTTAATTFTNTHTMNVGFHPNAFALVMVPLEMPDSAPFKARETYNGMSVRVIKDYNFTDDYEQIRLDVFYGVKTIYPELAVRLMG